MSAKDQKTAAAAVTETTEDAQSLLDQVVAATRPQNKKEAQRTRDYFKEFLNQVVEPGKVVSKDVEDNINHWIGEIDKEIRDQTEAIRPDPSNAEYHEHRGLIYQQIGDLDHFLADSSEVARLCDVGTANHED